MPQITRRRFIHSTLAGAAALSAGGMLGSRAWATGRVVIIGGGPAGAAAALALRTNAPDLDVLLVERDPARGGATSVFDKPDAGPSFDALSSAGVEVMLDDVVDIDWHAERLEAISGRRPAFDRLILAPGSAPVDEAIPGLDAVARHHWPAAWGSRREARRLSAQLAALPEHGHVVLRLPSALSHPHVALARAQILAETLGRTRPNARLTVLDGGNDPQWRSAFMSGPGRGSSPAPRIVWRLADEGGAVQAVDARAGLITTSAGIINADVVNFVTRHGAGSVAQRAGLADPGGWCPTDAAGLSLHRPQALILGDARAGATRTIPAALASRPG